MIGYFQFTAVGDISVLCMAAIFVGGEDPAPPHAHLLLGCDVNP